ncbi:MAG: peroxiredoxin [Coxiella sp. (in: Bacteria)]|nr:MAG: peroxiredoxin [Coxiella sp. (in: g-proteobacteria)]
MTTTLNKAILNHEFASSDGPLTLDQFDGKTIVLFFYPKDNTSGCTLEAQNFRDTLAQFTKQDTVILGVSRDNLKSHTKFINDHELNFTLISDPDETLCNAFDVMKEKSMFGRKYMGIERSTFILDSSGNVANEWRKVKVPGHVDEVLASIAQ